ncbi:MAG: hypothetical protein K1X89_22070 [Myxococcaceae bacterium]|nr:hypothetical protein [Myxococcaceae bacterium]
MKLILIAAVTASAFFVGLKSNQASAATPSAAMECGKLHETCTGSVICCSGLSCISRSGADPTCEER